MECFNELNDCNLNLYNVVAQNKQPSCAVTVYMCNVY